MANADDPRCRLVLVTPPAYEVKAFRARLMDALAGGDVASLIVTAPNNDPSEFQRAAETFAPMAADRNVAALIHNDTRLAAYAKADGVHLDGGKDAIAEAIAARAKTKKIVGIGNVRSRHEALEAGESDPDYLFFGRLDGDFADTIFPKALELAAWWSSVTIIPAVVMGGRTVASVAEAAGAGIAFVALSEAVWEHPKGPAAAVEEAALVLAGQHETTA